MDRLIIYILVAFLLLALIFTILTVQKNKKLEFENQIIKMEFYDKEQAIKDYAHRVKNNLQLINSLLSYQSLENSHDEVTSFSLKWQKRINSIILLHENFDLKNNDNEVNFKKYIEGLFDFFSSVFKIEKKSIQFQLEVNDLFINLETALPLGIILNELICNSLLHAFPPDKSENVISISMQRLKKDVYHLSYHDNGIGFQCDSKTGLGLKIIELQSKQINAKYFYESSDGFNFKLSFKLSNFKL